MARAPKQTPAPEGAPKTTNELTDEQRHALFENNFAKYLVLSAAAKKAQKALKDHGKIIKADLGDYGLDMIKLRAKIEGDDSDVATAAAKEQVINMLRVMRWSGVPIGHTDDLFENFDARPLEEQAEDFGKIAGMRGEPMKAPERWASGDLYQAWCKGWNAGQEQIFNIRPSAAGGDGTAH